MNKAKILVLALAGSLFFITGFSKSNEAREDQQAEKIIIWNDDPESMPKEGEKVVIELIQNDTIYIGTVEANKF